MKQGFGRLIRHRGDHGIVGLLDGRVARKSYGATLRGSLPADCPRTESLEDVAAFWARVHPTAAAGSAPPRLCHEPSRRQPLPLRRRLPGRLDPLRRAGRAPQGRRPAERSAAATSAPPTSRARSARDGRSPSCWATRPRASFQSGWGADSGSPPRRSRSPACRRSSDTCSPLSCAVAAARGSRPRWGSRWRSHPSPPAGVRRLRRPLRGHAALIARLAAGRLDLQPLLRPSRRARRPADRPGAGRRGAGDAPPPSEYRAPRPRPREAGLSERGPIARSARREGAGGAAQRQVGERHVEARRRQRFLRAHQVVLRREEIDLGDGPRLILRADEIERLRRQVGPPLGCLDRLPLGLEQAAGVGQIVANTVAQDGGLRLDLEGLRGSQVALRVPRAAVEERPVELRADGPGVVVTGEADVVADVRLGERRQRGGPLPAVGAALGIGGLGRQDEPAELGAQVQRAVQIARLVLRQ